MNLRNNGLTGFHRGRFVIAIILVTGMFLARYSGIGQYINLAFIWEHKDTLQVFLHENYTLSVIFFVSLLIVAVAFAIPMSIILTIAAGYFFGVVEGTIYSTIGASFGALASFFTFRYLLREGLKKKYGRALADFNKKFKKHGAYYLLFLQLLPITPFGFITIVAGLSDISAWTFYWTTALGILPGSAIYAFAGSELVHVSSARDILSLPIIIALTLLALLALMPVIINYFKVRSRN